MKKSFITYRWIAVCRAAILAVIAVTVSFVYTSLAHSQYSELFTIPERQQFLRVSDFAVDGRGNIYVTSEGKRVVKIDPAGKELFHTVTLGKVDGQIDFLAELALDRDGNIYVSDSGNARILKFDADGNFLLKFGTKGTGAGQFNSITGIVLDSSNNMYVSDARNNRIQKFDSHGNFLLKFGTAGNENGQFMSPNDIILDNAGNIYVTDSGNHRMQKFDSQGNFLLKFGNKGTGNGQFFEPTSVAIDREGNIYVPYFTQDRIQKFDSAGNFLTNLQPDGSGKWEFDQPSNITFDTGGNLYILDLERYRIQKFDPSGNVLAEFGTKGWTPGRFNRPSDIVIDNDENIYVADVWNHRIQKFDPHGSFISAFRPVNDDTEVGGLTLDSAGNIYAVITSGSSDTRREEVRKFTPEGNLLLSFGSRGSGDGQFLRSTGIALDSIGNIYVSDTNSNRVQKFDPKGNFLLKFDTKDSADGQPFSPVDIVLDSNGNIFVADFSNHLIRKFDSNGNIIMNFGMEGSENGQFIGPVGVTLDSKGDIYVTDRGNHRVQKFDSKGNYLSQFGSFGFETGKLRFPRRAAVGTNGNVYVADIENHRIQVFRPESVIDNDFSDEAFGGTTAGTIVDRGDQHLTITDEQSPAGVLIKADLSGGPEPSLITACNNSVHLTLDAGEEAVVTCGSSAHVDVKEGLIETVFTSINAFTATGSLPKGNAITFIPDPFTITASSDSTDTVTMDIVLRKKKASITVSPGQTIDLIVNDQVSQDRLVQSSFDPTPAPNAPKGTFTITASFTNRSSTPIKIPLFIVVKLTGDNLLLNADDRAGGVGATVTPDLDNDMLQPGESMTVDFVIGLQDNNTFSFHVDLLGVLGS